jgi:hypothetical protein
MAIDAHIDALVDRLIEKGAKLRRVAHAPWIEDVESQLGFKLPAVYRSLVTRYAFSQIELEKVELFSNLGDGSTEDLATAPFRDPHMSPWLISHRLVQIGRPSKGSYDPVCFDASSGNRDPVIVQLDHEDILQSRKEVRKAKVASSFLSLVHEATDA